jgi:hypothetical protein
MSVDMFAVKCLSLNLASETNKSQQNMMGQHGTRTHNKYNVHHATVNESWLSDDDGSAKCSMPALHLISTERRSWVD